MPTQLESARNGTVTDEMKRAAEAERLDPELLREGIAQGQIVLLCNTRHEGVVEKGGGKGVGRKGKDNTRNSRDQADPDV